MAQIIQLDFNKTNSASGVIDIATVQQSCRKLKGWSHRSCHRGGAH